MVGVTQQVTAQHRELLAAVQELSAVAQALGRVEAPPPAPVTPVQGPSPVAPPPRPADQFAPVSRRSPRSGAGFACRQPLEYVIDLHRRDARAIAREQKRDPSF